MQNTSFIPHMNKALMVLALGFTTGCCQNEIAEIDRVELLDRNSPMVTSVDTLASLTVGNGDFAMTVDVTGLQTFPERYSNGVPLGTMSTWGWHSFDNPENYRPEECLVPYDFGTGSATALYSQQVKANVDARKAAASDWLRANPHRLHLGCVGFDIDSPDQITDVHQRLDLMSGIIYSDWKINGRQMHVETACHPDQDAIGVRIEGDTTLALLVRVPGPTGKHSDDASDWLHPARIIAEGTTIAVEYNYDIEVMEESQVCTLTQVNEHLVRVTAARNDQTSELSFRWNPKRMPVVMEGQTERAKMPQAKASEILTQSRASWLNFWMNGAAVDFSECTDPRASEMERRVVLSQYLLAVNSAGHVPPQETGLTYNSWFGKFHLEMIYWHQAWLPLWGHGSLLDRTLSWYQQPQPHSLAKEIAERQGYRGVRWMKMTDPSGMEAPSKVGSFLIWQQAHPIYLAELLRRESPDILDKYYDLVMETATMMSDFAVWEPSAQRFVLKGNIPAQETLKASEVVNSPYELSEWLTTLRMAQHWRELKGEEPVSRWDSIIAYLSPLAWSDEVADHSPFNIDSTRTYGKVYLACETTLDTYTDRRLTSDHMAVLGALGIYPKSRLIEDSIMSHTLSWVLDNWNWDKTWGWDYPMTAMCAARLNRPEDAVAILLNGERTNTYLPNGHNYQDSRLRCYLPGNGGLLTAVAMMCAGWDGCQIGNNPGWPRDGKWKVRWEGLKRIP